jgi:hypothetical protein
VRGGRSLSPDADSQSHAYIGQDGHLCSGSIVSVDHRPCQHPKSSSLPEIVAVGVRLIEIGGSKTEDATEREVED